MDIPCALAMTRAEFTLAQTRPKHMAWMACHFSSAGGGLSNLPDGLPAGSMLMIDDSFPPNGHDPERIVAQLLPFTSNGIHNILLDFQRPDHEENRQLARYLTAELPCRVCVTPAYAEDLDCPVLLPPPALHQHIQDHLALWKGRPIWLEATLDAERITVTEKGSSVTEEVFSPLQGEYFTDTALCCRYQIQALEDRVIFTLVRDRQMLRALLKKAAALGVTQSIGLYQQLGHSL